MTKGSPATAGSGSCVMTQQQLKEELSAVVAHGRMCMEKQSPIRVTAHKQELRERSFSSASTSSRTASSHQRRWSADFHRCGSSPAIVVKKSVREPQPPQRRGSLLGLQMSPNSPCSSPPVPTSVITGPDPLGWKMQPKSSSYSSRNKRLSLQISLPVIYPHHLSNPGPNSPPATQTDPKTKPPIKPKPNPRRHSDSSAFLRSMATPSPFITFTQPGDNHVHQATHLDDRDDVFCEGHDEEKQKEQKATTRPRKIPPPVPVKNSMARQIAQLIAQSYQRPVMESTKQDEDIYSKVVKPKANSRPQLDHRNL